MSEGPQLGVMDVGGSHVHAALFRSDVAGISITDRRLVALDSGADRDTLLDQLAAPAAQLGGSAWAVAMPGPFDYVLGRGDFAGVAKFGSLAGVDLRGALADRLALRGERVRFLNDAVAYGLGEWSDLTDRPDRFVCLTLGTGVGSAYLVSGRPVAEGAGVPPHGWAHLLTFSGRPLEDTVSARAIVADHARRTGTRTEVRQIAELARAGDPNAAASLDTAMHALGVALGPSLTSFGAERLVLGGAIARAWDQLEEPLRAGLRSAGGRVPELAPSRLGDDAPLVGAAHWLSRQSLAPYPAPTP